MSDMENISLEIESNAGEATQGLDKVVSALEKIEGILGGLSEKLDVLSNVGKATAGSIDNISKNTSKINTKKLDDVSKKLQDITSKSKDSNKAISDIGNDFDKKSAQLDKALDKLSRSFVTNFKIPKNISDIDKVTEAFKRFVKAKLELRSAPENASDEYFDSLYKEMMSASQAVDHFIRTLARDKKPIDDSSRVIREYVMGLSKDAYNLKDIESELTDEVGAIYRSLGSGISKKGRLGLDVFLQEFHSVMGEIVSSDLDPTEQIRKISEHCIAAREELVSLDEAYGSLVEDFIHSEISSLYNQIDITIDKYADVISKIQEMKAEEMGLNATTTEVATTFDSAIDNINNTLQTGISSVELFNRVVENAFRADTGQGNVFAKMFSAESFDFQLIGEVQDRMNGFIILEQQITEEAEKAQLAISGIFRPALLLADNLGQLNEETKKLNESLKPNEGNNLLKEIDQKVLDGADDIELLISKINAYKKIISGMESGKIGFDRSAYEEAVSQLGKLQEQFKAYKDSLKGVQEVENKIKEVKGAARPDTAESIFKDIEKEAAEGADEIQLLIDKIHAFKRIINETDSGKLPFDRKYFEEASKQLPILEAQYKSYKNSLRDIPKLPGEVVPTKQPKQANNDKESLTFMARIIAIQHELEKAAETMGWFGEKAEKAFKRALVPLKLFEHEFEEVKEFIEHTGSGMAMAFKPITKVFRSLYHTMRETFSVKKIFGNFAKEVNKIFSKISQAWGKVMQRFTFTLLRKAINQVITTINEAIKSLAMFSKTLDGKFNDSMSLLTSDFRYLGASIVAMLQPIINMLVPVLDALTEKVVTLINTVNMMLSSISGADKFVVAKKKIIDYAGALEEAQKKAKTLTMGIDELNILNEDTGKTDLEDMFDWQELPVTDFKIFDDEITDLFKRILQQLKDLLKAIKDAIKKAWENVRDYVIKAVKRLLKAVLQLFSDVLRDLIKVFKQAKTVELFETIFKILGDIVNVIAAIIEKIDEAWNHNNLGLQILEKIRDILLVIAKHVQNVTSYMVKWAESLTFIPLFEAFLQMLTQIEYAVDQVGYVFEDVAKLLLDLLKYAIEKAFPELIKFQGDVIEGFGNLAKNIHSAWEELEFGKVLFDDLTGIADDLLGHLRNVGDAFKDWTVNINFKPIMQGIDGLLDGLKPFFDEMGGLFERAFEDVLLPLVQNVIEKVAPTLLQFIGDIYEGIGNIVKGINDAWDALSFGEGVVDGISGIIDKLLEHLSNVGEKFKEWGANLNLEPLMEAFTNLLESLMPVADAIGGIFEDFIEHYVLAVAKHLTEHIIPGIMNAISHFADAVDWGKFRKNVEKVIEAFEHLAGAIGEGVVIALDKIGLAVAGFVNSDEFTKFINVLTNFAKQVDGEMIGKILTGIGIAILRVAKALVAFVNSEAFQAFIQTILNFLKNASAEDIANTIERLAKAILLFKFLEFTGKGVSNFLSFIVLISNAVTGIKKFIDVVGGLGKATKVASEATTTLSSSVSAVGTTIGTVAKLIGGVAAVIGGVVLAVKEFVDMWIGGWDVIKTILEALGLALAAVGAVLLGAPALVAGVVAGIVFVVSQLAIQLHEHWDAISQWFSETWENFKLWAVELWGNITQGIADTWNGFVTKVGEIWTTVTEFFGSIFDNFFEWALGVWNNIVTTIANVWITFTEIVGTIWVTVQEFFATLWENFRLWAFEIWNNIINTIATAWNGFTTVIIGIWNVFYEFIFGAWEAFREWAIELWQTIWDTIVNAWQTIQAITETAWGFVRDFVLGIWQTFSDKVKEVFEHIKKTISDVWAFIQDTTLTIWSAIRDFIVGLWNFIKTKATEIFGAIKEFLLSVWNAIQETWSKIWEAIRDAIIQIWEFISNKAHEIFEAIVGFLTTLWDTISDTWAYVWDIIVQTIVGIWEGVQQKAEEIWQAVVEFFTTLWDTLAGWWSEVWDGIISAIVTIWDTVLDKAHSIWDKVTEFFSGIWDGVQKGWQDVWKNIGEFIVNTAKNIVKVVGGIINLIIDILNKMIGGINGLSIDIPDNPITGAITLGFNIPSIPKLQIPAFSVGGFPEDGLFYANSSELVGQFNNGKTAVANNEQIQAGIAEGVRGANSEVVDMLRQVIEAIDNKDTTLAIDSREVARANTNGQSKIGRSLISVTN